VGGCHQDDGDQNRLGLVRSRSKSPTIAMSALPPKADIETNREAGANDERDLFLEPSDHLSSFHWLHRVRVVQS